MENVCAVQEEKKNKQTNKHFPFKWENYTKTEQKHNQSTFYYNFSVMEKSNKTFFFLLHFYTLLFFFSFLKCLYRVVGFSGWKNAFHKKES
jgi:hypothetical protein